MTTLLIFTAALLSCAVCAQSATPCPDCGTTPVPYPLSTGPSCGHPDYKIRCDAGTLNFPSLDTTYPIKSIHPESQSMVIQPASLVPNTCVTSDFAYVGLNLNESLPFNLTSSTTIMLLNCTERLLESPLNCSSISQCHAYIDGTPSAGACSDAPICCTFNVGRTASRRIRIRERGCSAYTGFVNLNPVSPVDQWPEPGLEIKWAPPPE